MAREASSIDLATWLQSPAGRYLLAWECQRMDALVGDVFGFHALQLGLPELDALRANRMPHRWLALHMAPACVVGAPGDAQTATGVTGPAPHPAAAACLHCDFDALPFPAQSLDLVVLPHTLELARDAHATLREVERVLVPEGRVVIAGFNPASLWGMRHWAGRSALRLGASPQGSALFLPPAGDFLAHRRLRDWLRLLSFEVESGGFGCYRPPLHSQRWLDRWAWMEAAGDRWWPMFGAVYLLSAVKRVRGMRLISPAWKKRRKALAAPAVASHRQHTEQSTRTSE